MKRQRYVNEARTPRIDANEMEAFLRHLSKSATREAGGSTACWGDRTECASSAADEAAAAAGMVGEGGPEEDEEVADDGREAWRNR